MRFDRLLLLSLGTKWQLMLGDGMESDWITRLHFKTLLLYNIYKRFEKDKIVTAFAYSMPSASLARLNIAFTCTFICCTYISTLPRPA